MTNSKSTKGALLTSSISILLCVAMLLGTTFAWFTDSATSSGNIIKAGNLDVTLHYADGTKAVPAVDADWKDASEEAIFTYENWEPGYTDVKHIKIGNAGTLALKYQFIITAESGISKLADVIDVYFIDPAAKVADRTELNDSNKVGTLTEVLKGMPANASGKLEKEESDTVTIALKMQETADNEYQDETFGKFSVKVLATQLEAESDSFGDDYDKDAAIADEHVATADDLVKALEENTKPGYVIALMNDVKIEPASMSNAYGTTGINIKNGQTLDGNGNTLDIKGAGGTWDSGINTTGGTIKNITVTGSFRGIFINHNSTHSEPVILENVTIDGTVYTISCDQGTGKGLTATNSIFNGWTSYAATLGNATFNNCKFGEGSGYAYCRPYAPTAFVNCDFEAGFTVDPRAAVTFENCTVGGAPLTADNLATLVKNTANATIK